MSTRKSSGPPTPIKNMFFKTSSTDLLNENMKYATKYFNEQSKKNKTGTKNYNTINAIIISCIKKPNLPLTASYTGFENGIIFGPRDIVISTDEINKFVKDNFSETGEKPLHKIFTNKDIIKMFLNDYTSYLDEANLSEFSEPDTEMMGGARRRRTQRKHKHRKSRTMKKKMAMTNQLKMW